MENNIGGNSGNSKHNDLLVQVVLLLQILNTAIEDALL
jgi:hypothetical protein